MALNILDFYQKGFEQFLECEDTKMDLFTMVNGE